MRDEFFTNEAFESFRDEVSNFRSHMKDCTHDSITTEVYSIQHSFLVQIKNMTLYYFEGIIIGGM